MTQSRKSFLGSAFALVVFVACASILGSSAFAGECPAGAMKPNAREPVTFQPVGVTDTTLGSIDSAKKWSAERS